MVNSEEKKILVLIPAYNEAENIGAVIDETIHQMSVLPHESDVMVVDDGSVDDTAAVARAHGAQVIKLPLNAGIGVALQTGFKFAIGKNYAALLRLDADGQHPAEYINAVLAPIIAEDADLCIGSRFLQRKGYQPSTVRRLGISWFSFLIAVIFKKRITDPTSGFQAISPRLASLYAGEYASDYPEVEALVTALGNGLRVMEVPIEMKERQSGRSSINWLHSIYYAIKVSTKVFISLLRK